MLEVKTNKEVRNIKENVYFGLDLKMCIILITGIIINTVIYFVSAPFIEESFRGVIITVCICPFIFFAFYKKDGLTGWRYIKNWLYYNSLPDYFFFSGSSLWKVPDKKIKIRRWKRDEKQTEQTGKDNHSEA